MAVKKAPTRVELSDIGRRRAERRLASGRKSDVRWASILQGAGRVFQKLGYNQATLEHVAAEVGVNRATLYYYVGTKEELLVALLYGPIHEMTKHMRVIDEMDLEPDEKLRRILRQYVDDMQETPELFVFLAENLHQVMTGREAEDIANNASNYGVGVTRIIKTGMKSGVFRDDIDPKMAMLAIIGMFNWIHRWFRPNGPHTLDEIGDIFCEMALASLRPV